MKKQFKTLVTIALAWHGANYSSCATVSSGGATADILTTQVAIVQAPPQFTNVTVVNNANAGTLCTTSLNVTDSTVVLDTLTPGQYDNLHDYNTILRSNRSIFPTFGNELVIIPADSVGLANGVGSSFALSGDGSVIAVGEASQLSSGPQAGPLTVYLYRHRNSTWVLQQELQSPFPFEISDFTAVGFGYSLALSYDGSILAVGSPFLSAIAGSGITTVDHVFLYTYQPQTGKWQLLQTIGGTIAAGFGSNVSLSATGQYLTIYQSLFPNNTTVTNVFSPLLWVYKRQNTCSGNPAWQQVASLSPVDSSGNNLSAITTPRTLPPQTVISADGSTIIMAYVGAATGAQLAIFKQQSTTWQQIQLFTFTLPSVTRVSASVSANGKYVALGIASQQGFSNGQLYLFAQRGSLYEQEALFTGPNSYFGTSVSLSADGTMLVVGSGNFVSAGRTSGLTVFLRGPDNRWSQQAVFSAPANDAFGAACAISPDGNIIVAGAPGGAPSLSANGYFTIFSPVGSFIPNDTVVSGSLCVYHQTTVDANLKVAGNIHAHNTIVTGTAGQAVACTAPSDGRVKDNIQSLDPQRAWEVIRSLRPVEFDWNNKPDPFDTKLLRNFTQGERVCRFARTECFSQHGGEKCIERMSEAARHAGFVAQELEKQFPHWVTTELSPDGNVKMIYLHHELYAYLVTAALDAAQRTQRQQEKVDQLESGGEV